MNNNIIWVNGCFDILHIGHIEMLKFAKNLGGLVYVGIDSDIRIKSMKGDDRPYQNQNTRLTILESIKYVDKVMIFDTSYQLQCLVEDFNPKAMVIGEEYKKKDIVGGQFCDNIIFFPRIQEHSTTNIFNKIKNFN